ncbi:integrase, catalytic region, zinc finger, CCHC-type containing protein, partial [Tanacetum coccineum]
GDDLLTGSRDSNLYRISISEMANSSPACLISRATSTKSWLWHHRLSYLNFGTINQLTSKDLVDGLPKFKYNKDHLCSAREQGKSKNASLPPKLVPSTESKLELLHMDLCGPMRVASIIGKKYILVIVDDYSRNLKAQILKIQTDNGTEFKNKKLRAFYAKLGIVHQTSIARTPQQNGVVERRNHPDFLNHVYRLNKALHGLKQAPRAWTKYQLADLFTKALLKERFEYSQDWYAMYNSNSVGTSGKILLDHPLSYDLTATADVPVVHLQPFWRTVSKVPGPEDTIKFMLNTQDFIYTMDMLRDILHLPMETPKNPFVAPVNIETIDVFMNKVGCQGVVDKVSAFYTKNLAQPWQTMFKVFNRCLTTRIFGHDQTKINILQLFHAMINRKNVDYAALLWWDFMNNVRQKKEAIQSTPRAHRTPTLTASPQGKKRKQSAGESSSPRKTHKITIKKRKQSTPSIPPPSDDRDRDAIAEASLLCLALHKTSLAAETQENVAKVQEKLDEEEIEKMVEGEEDEESYASAFADFVFNDDVDDSGTKIEPESHNENPEEVDDDDVEIEKKDDVEIEKEKKDE